MVDYSIELAGLPLCLRLQYPETAEFLKQFHTDSVAAAPMPALTAEYLENVRPQHPDGMADWLLECNELPFAVSNALLPYGCCLFHGVAFVWQGKAWILTAPSGTGKTTQFVLWKLRYGDEVNILNGDKPVLECRPDGSVWVHPSPWRGKENIGRMESAPLGGIIMLAQREENRITQITPKQAAGMLYRQFLYWPEDEAAVDRVCAMAEQILRETPVWFLANRGDDASAQLTHDTITEWRKEHAV